MGEHSHRNPLDGYNCPPMHFPETLDELDQYANRRRSLYKEAADKLTNPEDIARLMFDCFSDFKDNERQQLLNIRDTKKLQRLFNSLSEKVAPDQSLADLSPEERKNVFITKSNEKEK